MKAIFIQFVLAILSVFAVLFGVEQGLRRLNPVRSNVFRMSSKGPLAAVSGWGPLSANDGIPFCNKAHGITPLPGATRILLLGDSILNCYPSPQYLATVPYLLARSLGPSYEVINVSAGGWGTDQEVLAYPVVRRNFKPDIVLLFFTPSNDLVNNITHFALFAPLPKPYFELLGNGELKLHELKAGAASEEISDFAAIQREFFFETEIGKRLYLAKLRYTRSRPDGSSGPDGWIFEDRYTDLVTYAVPQQQAIADSWVLTAKILEKFRDDVTKDGARFGIVYVPTGMDIGKCDDPPSAQIKCAGYSRANVAVPCGKIGEFNIYQPLFKMREVAAALHVPLIENIADVEKFADNYLSITSDCLHPNKAGAAMLATKVKQFLEK